MCEQAVLGHAERCEVGIEVTAAGEFGREVSKLGVSAGVGDDDSCIHAGCASRGTPCDSAASASVMTLASSGVKTFGFHLSCSVARLASPINASTSVGRR